MTKKYTRIKHNIGSPIINGDIKGDLINQIHTGSGDNFGKNKNINNSQEFQKFTPISEEIQVLLEKLEQTYNPNTELGQNKIAKEAIEEIEHDSNLAKRIISASEKGLIAYLQARFISPVQSAFLAALEDWQKNKK